MNERRRVLLCCEQYAPSVGGVQEVMRQIAERLASQGEDVVVATGAHPRRAQNAVINGVKVVSFPVSGNKVRGMTGPVADYQAFLREGGFDAVLIKAAQQWTFDAAVDVLPGLDARKIFIPCGFSGLRDPRYADYFLEMAHWLRLFDGLVFYADSYQDITFARAHGLTALHLIPNGVDEREFASMDAGAIREELGIPAGDDVVLSVGSMIAGKGHWEVLAAFRQAQLDRPTTLVLNGNAPGGGALGSLKRALKHALSGRWPISLLAGRVGRMPGKRVIVTDLPRPRLLALYKTADLFAFASHVEYSPLVLFEAAAAATPFIASDVGNSREIAQWTGAGTIVSETGPDGRTPSTPAFARAIETALRDLPALHAAGARGRAAVFDNGLTWARIVAKYREVLEPR